MVDKILHGTSGNDELWGNSYQSPDVYVEPFEEYYAKVYGYGGDDVIYNGRWVDAGAGNDTIYDDIIDSTIFAGAGNDAIYDREGTDIVDAGSGDDFFVFQALYYYEEDRDVVSMGTGNDIALVPLLYNGAYRTLDGGDGVDTLMLTNHSDRAGTATMDFRPLSKGSSMVVDKVTLSSFEQVYLEGTSVMKTVFFGEGNDTFIGMNGSTTVYGGGGNDYLDSTSSGSTLYGGDGDDIIIADAGGMEAGQQNRAYGGNGNDMIYASYLTAENRSHGTLSGGAGSDGFIETFLTGSTRNHQGEEDTVVDFNPAEDWIGLNIHGTRTKPADTQRVKFAKKNYIETAEKISFDVTMEFDERDFTIEYHKKTGKLVFVEHELYSDWTTVELIFSGAPKITFDNFYLMAQQRGTPADELIQGNHQANFLRGAGGDDRIYGYEGDDELSGDGYEAVVEEGGNDILDGGLGADYMYGGVGNDVYFVDNPGDVVDEKLLDGAGRDTVKSSISWSLVRSSTAIGAIENLTLLGSTNISATGNGLNNVLTGNAGRNSIAGNAGNDTLDGGAGNDILIGGMGGDRLIGGHGTDTASYAGATLGVVANLSNPTANTNDARGDTYISIEHLVGSSHADKLYGNSGANAITGGSGNDRLSALAGNDVIYGGTGADQLYGGSGADKFLFKSFAESTLISFDTIFDFRASEQDRIDLSAIDANTKLAGNQTFIFIGASGYTGKGGELRVTKKDSDTYIYADVDGDKKSDLMIHLDDAITLTKDFFIL
jgi:Ca2+-binding RTX toxin-like protein